jgi:hypothetical protein
LLHLELWVRAIQSVLSKKTAYHLLTSTAAGTSLVSNQSWHYLAQSFTGVTYKVLQKDLTNKIERKTATLSRKLEISGGIAKKLITSAPVPPRLYGLPKIRNENVMLKPIVKCIGSSTYLLVKHLVGLLGPRVGLREHHVKNLVSFIQKLQMIHIQKTDILVIFNDVVSLFTNASLNDSLQLLKQHFKNKMFYQVLISIYFLFEGTFCEQTDHIAMGSLLALIMANFYMEYFEETALRTLQHKLTHWFRYVKCLWYVYAGKINLRNFCYSTVSTRTLNFLWTLRTTAHCHFWMCW